MYPLSPPGDEGFGERVDVDDTADAIGAMEWRYAVGLPPLDLTASLLPPAQQIARAQAPGWEFVFLAQVIEDAIASVEPSRRRAFSARRTLTGEQVGTDDVLGWLTARVQDMEVIVMALENEAIPAAIMAAMGPPGHAGDVQALTTAGRRLADVYVTALAWKLRVRGAQLPPRWKAPQQALAKYVDAPLDEVAGFSARLRAVHDQALAAHNARGASRTPGAPLPEVNLVIRLTIPDEVTREFRATLAMVAGA